MRLDKYAVLVRLTPMMMCRFSQPVRDPDWSLGTYKKTTVSYEEEGGAVASVVDHFMGGQMCYEINRGRYMPNSSSNRMHHSYVCVMIEFACPSPARGSELVPSVGG